MNETLQKIDSFLRLHYNKYDAVRAIVYLVLFLYASSLAPKPPPQVLKLFTNIYFRLFIFSLILWIAKFDPSVSLFVAFTFLVITNYVNTGLLWESLEQVETSKEEVKTPEDAIKVLANAALSSSSADIVEVSKVADVAMKSTTTEESNRAITDLAQQAIVPEAGVPEKVKEAVTTALGGIPVLAVPTTETAPEPLIQDKNTGCYSKRVYTMDKVVPITSFVDGDEFSIVKA